VEGSLSNLSHLIKLAFVTPAESGFILMVVQKLSIKLFTANEEML
jgi:hypothetical protein